MSDKLKITKIINLSAGKFNGDTGPFDGQSFEDFTVVYGRNETGKSTISDLMVWLLTAEGFKKKKNKNVPDEETLFRFGKKGDEVSGELKGSLRGKDFTLRASCTIGTDGDATKSDFSGVLGRDEFKVAKKWQEELFKLDEDLFGRIYFLQGLNLHSSRQQAVDQLQSLASGTDGFNTNTTMKNLADRVKEKLTLAGSSTPSGNRHRDNVEGELENAKEKRKNILSRADELSKSKDSRDDLGIDIKEKKDQKYKKDTKVKELEKRERLLEEVRDDWDDISGAVEEKDPRDEREKYHKIVSRLKNENVDLNDERVCLDEDASTELVLRIANWKNAQNDLIEAERSREDLQDDEKNYDEQFARALEAFEQVESERSPGKWGELHAKQKLYPQEETHDTGELKKGNNLARNLAAAAVVVAAAAVVAAFLPSPWPFLSTLGLGGFILVPYFNRSRSTGREANNTPTGLTDSQVDSIRDAIYIKWKTWHDCAEKLKDTQNDLGDKKKEVLGLEEAAENKKQDALSFAVLYGFEIGEDVDSAKKILKDVREGVRFRDDLKSKEKDFNKAVAEFSKLENRFIEANEGMDDFSGKAGDLSLEDVEEALEKIEDELADFKVEDLDVALNDLTREHQTKIDYIEELEGETEYSEIQDEIESLKEEILEREIEAASLEIARYLLGEATEKYAEEARPRFLQEVSKYYTDITGEDREVRWSDPDSDASVYVNVEGSKLELKNLSTASRAQLYLSFRLAMADQDAENKREGLKIPLICDDSLVHFDDDRAKATLPILEKISKERQVILFTCHERTRNTAEELEVQVIELG